MRLYKVAFIGLCITVGLLLIPLVHFVSGPLGPAIGGFIAGSKAILVSHWPVFSESTKDTMIDLFTQTQGNEISYSKSLQKAKISMIKNNKYDLFSHPTFWAPFVIVGIN